MTLTNKFIFAGDEGSILRLISVEDVDDELDIITGEIGMISSFCLSVFVSLLMSMPVLLNICA